MKPIKYFFGEDFGGEYVQDIISLIRKMPPELRKHELPIMTMMIRMNEINYETQNSQDKIKQSDAVKEFYELFLPYYNSMESLFTQLKEAKGHIDL